MLPNAEKNRFGETDTQKYMHVAINIIYISITNVTLFETLDSYVTVSL